ncbi:hypothetical protein BDZ85DRAFT_265741 [Elsinoe ampelina]|uniref:Uncharacterized protein n=1 Tax=Elsinoe ampelina TaxID=302913 RepID=A0A6A6G7L3_9PEZI|nr:hypothetical protein BDZ85DRAFT_265741 [Elsinoe ampelina]
MGSALQEGAYLSETVVLDRTADLVHRICQRRTSRSKVRSGSSESHPFLCKVGCILESFARSAEGIFVCSLCVAQEGIIGQTRRLRSRISHWNVCVPCTLVVQWLVPVRWVANRIGGRIRLLRPTSQCTLGKRAEEEKDSGGLELHSCSELVRDG